MGFEIKKLIEWWLSPQALSLLLLGVGLACSFVPRRQRLARALLAAGLFVSVLFSCGPVADALSRPLEQRYPSLDLTAPLTGIAAVAVLGAGYSPNPGKPAIAWLPDVGLQRLVEGLRVLRLAPGSRLVFSGSGGSYKEPEAEVMERAAVSLGVDPARIVRIDAPRDTAEEIAALHRLVGPKKVIIVTSAIHMPRAMDLAADQGLDAIAAPAAVAYDTASGDARSWMPSYEALARSSVALHEWIGRAWAWLVATV